MPDVDIQRAPNEPEFAYKRRIYKSHVGGLRKVFLEEHRAKEKAHLEEARNKQLRRAAEQRVLSKARSQRKAENLGRHRAKVDADMQLRQRRRKLFRALFETREAVRREMRDELVASIEKANWIGVDLDRLDQETEPNVLLATETNPYTFVDLDPTYQLYWGKLLRPESEGADYLLQDDEVMSRLHPVPGIVHARSRSRILAERSAEDLSAQEIVRHRGEVAAELSFRSAIRAGYSARIARASAIKTFERTESEERVAYGLPPRSGLDREQKQFLNLLVAKFGSESAAKDDEASAAAEEEEEDSELADEIERAEKEMEKLVLDGERVLDAREPWVMRWQGEASAVNSNGVLLSHFRDQLLDDGTGQTPNFSLDNDGMLFPLLGLGMPTREELTVAGTPHLLDASSAPIPTEGDLVLSDAARDSVAHFHGALAEAARAVRDAQDVRGVLAVKPGVVRSVRRLAHADDDAADKDEEATEATTESSSGDEAWDPDAAWEGATAAAEAEAEAKDFKTDGADSLMHAALAACTLPEAAAKELRTAFSAVGRAHDTGHINSVLLLRAGPDARRAVAFALSQTARQPMWSDIAPDKALTMTEQLLVSGSESSKALADRLLVHAFLAFPEAANTLTDATRGAVLAVADAIAGSAISSARDVALTALHTGDIGSTTSDRDAIELARQTSRRIASLAGRIEAAGGVRAGAADAVRRARGHIARERLEMVAELASLSPRVAEALEEVAEQLRARVAEGQGDAVGEDGLLSARDQLEALALSTADLSPEVARAALEIAQSEAMDLPRPTLVGQVGADGRRELEGLLHATRSAMTQRKRVPRDLVVAVRAARVVEATAAGRAMVDAFAGRRDEQVLDVARAVAARAQTEEEAAAGSPALADHIGGVADEEGRRRYGRQSPSTRERYALLTRVTRWLRALADEEGPEKVAALEAEARVRGRAYRRDLLSTAAESNEAVALGGLSAAREARVARGGVLGQAETTAEVKATVLRNLDEVTRALGVPAAGAEAAAEEEEEEFYDEDAAPMSVRPGQAVSDLPRDGRVEALGQYVIEWQQRMSRNKILADGLAVLDGVVTKPEMAEFSIEDMSLSLGEVAEEAGVQIPNKLVTYWESMRHLPMVDVERYAGKDWQKMRTVQLRGASAHLHRFGWGVNSPHKEALHDKEVQVYRMSDEEAKAYTDALVASKGLGKRQVRFTGEMPYDQNAFWRQKVNAIAEVLRGAADAGAVTEMDAEEESRNRSR